MKKLLCATLVASACTGNILASDGPPTFVPQKYNAQVQLQAKPTHQKAQNNVMRSGWGWEQSLNGNPLFNIGLKWPKRFQDILKHLTPGLVSALIQTVFLDKTSKNYSLQRLVVALLAPYFSYLLLEQEPGNKFEPKTQDTTTQSIQTQKYWFNVEEAQKNRQAQRTIAYLSTLIAAAPFVWDLLTKTQRKPNIQVSSFVKLIK